MNLSAKILIFVWKFCDIDLKVRPQGGDDTE